MAGQERQKFNEAQARYGEAAQTIHEEAQKAGLGPLKDDELVEEAARYMVDDGIGWDDALERVAIEDEGRHANLGEGTQGEGERVPQVGGEGAERGAAGLPAEASPEARLAREIAQLAQDRDIEFFQSARGKIRLSQDARPIITLMKDANASTFIHESGHQFLEELTRDALHPAAPDELKADTQTVRDWLGVKAGEDIKTRQHEKFARGFEQYLREGVAPSAGLARVFAKFRAWMLGIYQTLKGLGQPISEDIRGVFDRLLATEPRRTVIAPEAAFGPTLAEIHEADAESLEPPEAEAGADRVIAERDRYVREQPEEIQRGLAAAGETIEPPGENGERPSRDEQVAESGGEPRPVAPSGSGSVGHGAVERGGGETVREGGDLSGSEQRRRNARDTSRNDLAPAPTTLFGPAESPFTDRAGNIRLDNLTSRQDVAQAIRDAAAENQDFIGDRRGIVTDGQVMDLADALGMTFEKLSTRKIGQAFNAEQVVAARKLLIQSATTVSAAMQSAGRDDATDQEVMAYAEARDRHQMIQAQVAGITAEAGRALRAFRDISGQMPTGLDQFVQQATGKTLFQLREEAKLGAKLDTPEKVSKYLQDAQKRTFGRMLLEYWINGLISGPSTHTTYMIGNTLLAMEKAGPETATAAAIGALRGVLGRQGERVRMGEVGAQMKAALQGVPGGLEAALEALRSGATTRLPGEAVHPRLPLSGDQDLVIAREAGNNLVTWSDLVPQVFGIMRGLRDGVISGAKLVQAGGVEGSPLFGLKYQPTGYIPDIAVRGMNALPLGTALRVPSRFIAAIHSFFRSVNYSMDKSAQAYRVAAGENLAGTAFDARVADLRQNPTIEIMERARESATELTLMGRGSEFVQAVNRLTNANIFGFPILKFISPFVHIAGNIIDQSILQRTPVGILAPEIRADLSGANGNIAQDMAMARMITGSMLGLTFGGLAAEGYATGSGPAIMEVIAA